MEKDIRIPQNKFELLIFQAVVSIISVNIIVPIIVMQNQGFSWRNYYHILSVIPFMWLAVVLSLIIANKPATWLKRILVEEEDIFKAKTTLNIFCHVLIVSACMTIFSTWIRDQTIELSPFLNFFISWPHNFGIAFAIQLCISQPVTRKNMILKHKN